MEASQARANTIIVDEIAVSRPSIPEAEHVVMLRDLTGIVPLDVPMALDRVPRASQSDVPNLDSAYSVANLMEIVAAFDRGESPKQDAPVLLAATEFYATVNAHQKPALYVFGDKGDLIALDGARSVVNVFPSAFRQLTRMPPGSAGYGISVSNDRGKQVSGVVRADSEWADASVPYSTPAPRGILYEVAWMPGDAGPGDEDFVDIAVLRHHTWRRRHADFGLLLKE